MLFEIKHRYSGKVIFSVETETMRMAVELGVKAEADLSSADLSSADLSSADLSSANLRYADLRSADLSSANLSSADLRYANLSSANLRSADLRSADLRYADLRSAMLEDGITVEKTPIQIYGAKWDITVWDSHIKIGCEFHSMAEWFAFSDKQINEMDHGALKFWRHWKEPLKSICIAENRYQEEEKAA